MRFPVVDHGATVVADSISPAGKRIRTLIVRMWRGILAEFNTHRVFSRNAASSRAIPIEKMIERVETRPFVPIYWGKNQPGMQAAEELQGFERQEAISTWLMAKDAACEYARVLHKIGAHKQNVNRLLEPWMFTEVVVTSTEWDNFFRQRDDKAAEPHMQLIARAMRKAMEESVPRQCQRMEWHRPFVSPEDVEEISFQGTDRFQWPTGGARDRVLNLVSAARCARVSYANHDGSSPDWRKDLALAEKLIGPGHWSPFEHVARAESEASVRSRNFFGWTQFRTFVDGSGA